MKIKTPIYLIVTILITIVVCVVVGLVIGVTIGANTDNYATCNVINGVSTCNSVHSFVYMGAPGSEGGAVLGLQLGAIIGLGAGIYLWSKHRNDSIS